MYGKVIIPLGKNGNMQFEFLNSYRKKRVLVTGHTGFKGSWLCQWLLLLDCEVYGYALDPPTEPALFKQLDLSNHMHDTTGDIRDLESIKNHIKEIKPDIIFHLAAQSLVRESYINPIYTIETNITGTANLLDTVRQLGVSTNIIVITSDICV